MDTLFQTQSNELSTTTQKEKLFKDAERQWNTLSTEKGAPGRKVDFEIYKSILYNLEIRKVYLDSKLSLEKFSSIVGTNTTYLSNAVNNYFWLKSPATVSGKVPKTLPSDTSAYPP